MKGNRYFHNIVIHLCPGKKATTFAVKGVAGLGATILLYYRFILTVK